MKALFYLMLGYTLGALSFQAPPKDLMWGGLLTIALGTVRAAVGFFVFTPIGKELDHTDSLKHRVAKWLRTFRRVTHYADHHQGKTWTCQHCRLAS